MNQCILEENQLFVYCIQRCPDGFVDLSKVCNYRKNSYRMPKEWDRKYQTLNVDSYDILLEVQFHLE